MMLHTLTWQSQTHPYMRLNSKPDPNKHILPPDPPCFPGIPALQISRHTICHPSPPEEGPLLGSLLCVLGLYVWIIQINWGRSLNVEETEQQQTSHPGSSPSFHSDGAPSVWKGVHTVWLPAAWGRLRVISACCAEQNSGDRQAPRHACVCCAGRPPGLLPFTWAWLCVWGRGGNGLSARRAVSKYMPFNVTLLWVFL